MRVVLIYLIQAVFALYTFFLILRVLGSWLPRLAHTTFMRFIGFYTDPYLNIFRKIIPPIGGMIDLSPIIAFFALQIVRTLLLSFLR